MSSHGKMPSRGKIIMQMAKNLSKKNSSKSVSPIEQDVKNEPVVETEHIFGNKSVSLVEQDVENKLIVETEPTSKNMSCDQSLVEYGNTAGPGNSRNNSISCITSSDCSSDSSPCNNSSSSSEDCDDLFDGTYIPTDKNSSETDEENLDVPDSRVNGATKSPNGNPELSTNLSCPATQEISILSSPLKKGLKRKLNKEQWKRNLLKKARNSGKATESSTRHKSIREERKMKPACGEKCKLQCSTKLNEDERKKIFTAYWGLGDLQKQWQYIASSMEVVEPKYRYIRIGGTRNQRQNNNAFYFHENSRKIRVCKLFFKNTLDITDRPIRTVIEKKGKVANVLLGTDLRGKHGKQKTVDPSIRVGIKQHIDSIPKIESHYTRANTSKHFIDGSKSISDIYKDYVTNCKAKHLPYSNYVLFYRVFTQDYNISFFVPKKDLCDTCVSFENAEGDEKMKMKDAYDNHLVQKELARAEKKTDKETPDVFVAVYDLQAVMQLPKGEISIFYYKSKLNVFNFTIYDLKTNECDCFVWDEGNANRGINELGTCILQYIRKVSAKKTDAEIIFYSDNCAGQQKNKFIIALYLYAIRYLGIKSITHKYLIKGHTQNEGDSAHSLIERQVKRLLKGGPMYTPESFVSAIRSARKTEESFNVTEYCYEDFYNIKALATEIGPLNMSELKISEVKVLKVVKELPTSVLYKKTYDTEFIEATVIKKMKMVDGTNIELTPAFHARPGLPQRKKDDLLDLVRKNLIPKYYKSYFENL